MCNSFRCDVQSQVDYYCSVLNIVFFVYIFQVINLSIFVIDIQGDDNFTLEAANQVYVAENYQLTAEFQSALKEHFGAPAENVNFGAEKTRLDINKWVEDFTHQKIKDLLPGGNTI